VPPPGALRPYLAFAKQTPRSLEAIARVVDADPELRARVAEVVDEDQVGRGGWLWLVRPDGWQDELAALEADSTARADAAAERRAERAATRKLAALQATADRAEAEAASRQAELDEARLELGAEQQARAASAARVAELAAQVEQLGDERRRVVRNLKDTEARLVERGTQLNASRARVRALEAEARARASEAGGTDPGGPQPGADASTGDRARSGGGDAKPDDDRAATRSRAGAGPPVRTGSEADAPGGAVPGGTGVAVPAVIVSEVARAAEAAASLADALAAVAEALEVGGVGPAPPVGPTDAGGSPVPPPVGGDDGGAVVAAAERVPLALPGGMFDDSVEAAEHLLRAPGAVLVVDGYNVTMTGWPELDGPGQRRRLVDAVSDLALRTSTAVELVFDGAEVEPLTPPPPSRPMVRVRFSDPGVEADDVIIDLVGRIPAATPVIVASSDNRVRTGVRRRGANVLHARQLVAVLRR